MHRLSTGDCYSRWLPGLEPPPIRAELFNIAQLERHARAIAAWHELAPATARDDRLLPRLRANELALRDAYDVITDAVQRGRQITPAAEWFIDNYHLIEEQIRTARRHLPRGYQPRAAPAGQRPRRGTPRVYDIALELISHAHGRVDGEASARSSPRTRRSSRCGWASCGRSRSCCGWR